MTIRQQSVIEYDIEYIIEILLERIYFGRILMLYRRSQRTKELKQSLSIRQKNLCLKSKQKFIYEALNINWIRYSHSKQIPRLKRHPHKPTYQSKQRNPQAFNKYRAEALVTDCLDEKQSQAAMNESLSSDDIIADELLANISHKQLLNYKRRSILDGRRTSKFKNGGQWGEGMNKSESRKSMFSQVSNRQSRRNSTNINHRNSISISHNNNLHSNRKSIKLSIKRQSGCFRPSIFKRFQTKNSQRVQNDQKAILIRESSELQLKTQQKLSNNNGNGEDSSQNQDGQDNNLLVKEKFILKRNKVRKRKLGQLNIQFNHEQQQENPKKELIINKVMQVPNVLNKDEDVKADEKCKEVVKKYYTLKRKGQLNITTQKQQEEKPPIRDKQRRYVTEGDECLLPKEYMLKYSGTANDFMKDFHENEKQRRTPIFEKYIEELVKQKVERKRPLEQITNVNQHVQKRFIEYIGKSSQIRVDKFTYRERSNLEDRALIQRGFMENERYLQL